MSILFVKDNPVDAKTLERRCVTHVCDEKPPFIPSEVINNILSYVESKYSGDMIISEEDHMP